METTEDALEALNIAWPHIVMECRQALGSELYYQALVYHCLRSYGHVPIGQLGMNVKMWISDPVSLLFKRLDLRKHERYRGGFEPIPDVCFFSPQVGADWRRRKRHETLTSLLLAIEIKASERENGRLRSGEVIADIEKLAAHRDEVRARNSSFLPIAMVIDTAREATERMTDQSLKESQAAAKSLAVGFMYLSPEKEINTLSANERTVIPLVGSNRLLDPTAI